MSVMSKTRSTSHLIIRMEVTFDIDIDKKLHACQPVADEEHEDEQLADLQVFRLDAQQVLPPLQVPHEALDAGQAQQL